MLITPYLSQFISTNCNICNIIMDSIANIKENSILCISSKVVSIAEGRVIPVNSIKKKDLIRESAHVAPAKILTEHTLTITHNMLVPASGIDESNANGVYVLYPKEPQKSAAIIWQTLREAYKINHLGIIITDSNVLPLRRGVIGMGLAWCGFEAYYSYIGQKDCTGRELKVTAKNNVDSLATAAVFCMGEGAEQTPFAILENAPKIVFQQRPPIQQELDEFLINPREDLYSPLLQDYFFDRR